MECLAVHDQLTPLSVTVCMRVRTLYSSTLPIYRPYTIPPGDSPAAAVKMVPHLLSASDIALPV
jgi:hypothetical protein